MAITELTSLDRELLAEFLPYFQAGFKAPYLGSIYEWASENVTLHNAYKPPGPFDVSLSRYLMDPFKALRDPVIRQVNVMASPRSGKTLLAELWLLWAIANNPAPFLWLQSSEKQMKKVEGLRMTDLVRSCQPVANLLKADRHAITKDHYKFANGMTVHLESAKLNALQGIGYNYIAFDECWCAEPGLIAEAKARVGDFYDTSKILLLSQGPREDRPEWLAEFNSAPVFEWGWLCPECKKPQVLLFNTRREDGSWAGVVWEKNERTCPNNFWLPEEAAKTSALHCINVECKHVIKDTPANRHDLNAKGLYVQTKTSGDPKEKSFRWNSLADRKVSFAQLTQEFLEADNIAEYEHDNTSKTIFYQKRLARPKELDRRNLIELITDDYDATKEWPDEIDRFMGVDVQRLSPKFWYVCRAFSKFQARKIEHGFCDSWEELDAIRERLKVRYHKVIVDAGDGQNTDDIYAQCARYGKWNRERTKYFCYIAAHALEKNDYPHRIDGKEVHLPYSVPVLKKGSLTNDGKDKGIPGCPYYSWSALRIKSTLDDLRQQKKIIKYVTNNVDGTYSEQMNNEHLVTRYANKSKKILWEPIHSSARTEYWDAEAMVCLAASIRKLFTVSNLQVEADKEAAKKTIE